MKCLYFIFLVIVMGDSVPIEKSKLIKDELKKDLKDFHDEFEDLIGKITKIMQF